MNILVDTCGWIEWLTAGKLASSFEQFLRKPNNLIIPTLLQHELYKWVCREKNANLALEVIGVTEAGQVIDLDTNLALYAADISKELSLSMADSVIYATAKRSNALLVTCDKHFKHLDNIKFFEKTI